MDLLLTDVVMPVGSGREVAEVLQSKDHGLPVLFMSGSIGETFAKRMRLSTDLVLLQKPFKAEALLSAVGAALRGRVSEAPAWPAPPRIKGVEEHTP